MLSNRSDRNAFLLFLLFAVTVTALYFGPFVNNFFAFDDFMFLSNMAGEKVSILFGHKTLRMFSNSLWWPIYEMYGLNPVGYNLLNICLWGVNAAFFFVLIQRLFNDRSLSFLAAAIFAATASGSDAVFWKASSSALLSLFFCIPSLLAYLNYRERGGLKWLLWSYALFFLAIFSKEEAASLIFLILALEFLYLKGLDDIKRLCLRILPFAAIILLYLAANSILLPLYTGGASEPTRLMTFRPLYTLLGGWLSFFLSPQGGFSASDPFVYLTALFVLLSFALVRDRKMLVFAYAWVFFAFVPQSLTALGQFDPRFPVNSISRYLYFSSAGAALAMALVLLAIRKRFAPQFSAVLIALLLGLFIWGNYGRVQARGVLWREHGEPMRVFLDEIRRTVSELPPKTYIFVANAPAGRAFVQHGLRVLYNNPKIQWIVDPTNFRPKEGDTAIFIECNWQPDGSVRLSILPWSSVAGV